MLKHAKNALTNIPKKTKSIGLVAFGVVIGSTAAGFAAIPDANGVITACSTSTGLNPKIRLIDTATTTNCSSGETKVTWNQKGQKGDTGAQGPVGPQGPASSQIAHARLNTDGTLDTNFSKNIDNYETRYYISPDQGETIRYGCYKVSFQPKSVYIMGPNARYDTTNQVGLRSQPVWQGSPIDVDEYCGSNFNAVNFNETAESYPGAGYEFTVLTFFN